VPGACQHTLEGASIELLVIGDEDSSLGQECLRISEGGGAEI
jgi:hypothetical protein